MKFFILLYRDGFLYLKKYYFRFSYALKYKEKLRKQGFDATIIHHYFKL